MLVVPFAHDPPISPRSYSPPSPPSSQSASPSSSLTFPVPHPSPLLALFNVLLHPLPSTPPHTPTTPSGAPVPNLELHSAAASGNVGLVHYALTHGQPVNSLLHGCLPLHAACSGGSVSVVRMLIERGADVNAPRLPRRYSDGKRSGVPSVGTVGSTPLHFAAANGHAAIVQILLAGGAVPDKPDKNGMTPEDLAEMSGHSDVIRTIRVWEHLNRTDAQVSPSNSATTTEDGSVGQPGPSRHSITSSAAAAGAGVGRSGSMRSTLSVGRSKGKERAESFNSVASDVVALKGQLEQTLGLGGSRGTSNAATPGSGSGSRAGSGSATPSNLGIAGLFGEGKSTADLPSPFQASGPNSPRDSTIEGESLSRVTTGASASSSRAGSLNESLHAVPSPPLNSHPHMKSSRRPSLPSILEKAVHPGAAFRAAMRRGDRDRDRDRGTVSAETSPKHGTSLFRGRNHHRAAHGHPESPPTSATTGSTSNHTATKKYSKQSLLHLFKRSGSPPSRSPSPPTKSETAGRIIGADELDEGIERLRRASIDLDLRERGERAMSMSSASTNSHGMIPGGAGNGAGGLLDVVDLSDDGEGRVSSVSAPPTRTRFFEDMSVGPAPPATAGNVEGSLQQQQQQQQQLQPVGAGGDRPIARPRTSSGVISPSPLAREWARPKSDEESEGEDEDKDEDDQSPPQADVGVRRSKTEVSTPSSPRFGQRQHQQPSSSPLAGSSPRRTPSAPSSPASTRFTKPRSATLPSSGMAPEADLRKVASTVLLRDKERRIVESQGENGDEGDEDEEGGETENEREAREGVVREVDEQAEAGDGGDVDESELGSTSGLSTSTRPSKTSAGTGRMRGASIGSVTTSESTRLATPPSSVTRYTQADEAGSAVSGSSSDRGSDPRAGLGIHPLRPLTMATKDEQSSGVVGSGGGSGVEAGHELVEEDVTPPSIMSVALGSFGDDRSKDAQSARGESLPNPSKSNGDPNDEVAAGPSSPPTLSRSGTGTSSNRPLYRKVSSHAEAKDVISQNERDIIELAQMPMSADSSRSLSAHLAAFAENHAIEQEFARIERRKSTRSAGSASASASVSVSEKERKKGTRASRASGSSAGVGEREREGTGAGTTDGPASGSDSASFFSADSNLTTYSSRRSSDVSKGSKSVHSVKPRSTSSPMYTIDAPKTSVNSINGIYDRRAAAYRDRLAALTSAPPVLKPRRQSVGLPPVIRHERTEPVLLPSSLSAEPRPAEIEVDLHPNISSPMPVVSGPLVHSTPRKRRGSANASATASPGGAAAVAKAAQVYSTAASPRRQASGEFNSGNGSKSRVQSPTAAHASSSQFTTDPSSRSPSRNKSGTMSPTSLSATANQAHGRSLAYSMGMTSGAGGPSLSSPLGGGHHFAHKQGDGDDSDDPDTDTMQYTMIQNDWRGGFVVAPQQGQAMSPPGSGAIGAAQMTGSVGGNGRWGGIKGAIGHLRR